MRTNTITEKVNRRRFLRSAAGAGAALALGSTTLGRARPGKEPEPVNVALIGAGAQGGALITACLEIPGVRFQAVCDIWEAFSLRRGSETLKRYGHPARPYVDYEAMLAEEKDLDAILIATPDFWHARHTVACLNAGLHVYCEKEMSNTLEGARQMVEAARRTGKLLQIGHQRRSNPNYIFCRGRLLDEAKLLGRITAINGQWNRSVQAPLGCPKDMEVDGATLSRYGYKSMQQLRNWRWCKGLGGGPIVDLGSHQIDIYNWFLDARPTSVLASGRNNYYDQKTHEWYDTVMAVYEYDRPQGSVSAFYQTVTTNSGQGYFEMFMGHEGTLLISEKTSRCRVYREGRVEEAKWSPWVSKGYLTKAARPEPRKTKGSSVFMDARETIPAAAYELPLTMTKRIHQPHLENFFDAIRGNAKLTCAAEVGYESAVTVLRVNETVEAGRKLSFSPEDFVV